MPKGAKGKKTALDSFFGKTKKKKGSAAAKPASETDDLAAVWSPSAAAASTTTRATAVVGRTEESPAAVAAPKLGVQVKDARTSVNPAQERHMSQVLDEEEARQAFWMTMKKAAVKRTAPGGSPSSATAAQPVSWAAGRAFRARGPRVDMSDPSQFPTLSGKPSSATEDADETSTAQWSSTAAPAAKASVWGNIADAAPDVELPPEEEAPEQMALGEEVELIPGLGPELAKSDVKEASNSAINDLRRSHELDVFVRSVLDINPAEQDFGLPEGEEPDALYDTEEDYVAAPMLALQRGRQVVVEKLIEMACDWEADEREVVGPALVALMEEKPVDVELPVDEETTETQTLHGAAVDRSVVVAGVCEVLEFLDDILMDVPQADKYFANMLKPLVIVSDATTEKPCIPFKLLPQRVAKVLGVDEETLEAKRKAAEERAERRRQLMESARQNARPTEGGRPGRPRPGAALAALLGAAASDKPRTPAEGASVAEPPPRFTASLTRAGQGGPPRRVGASLREVLKSQLGGGSSTATTDNGGRSAAETPTAVQETTSTHKEAVAAVATKTVPSSTPVTKKEATTTTSPPSVAASTSPATASPATPSVPSTSSAASAAAATATSPAAPAVAVAPAPQAESEKEVEAALAEMYATAGKKKKKGKKKAAAS